MILHSARFSPNEWAFLYPLKRYQRLFAAQGIQLCFCTQVSRVLRHGEVLCISSKFFSSWWVDRGFSAIGAFLQRARQYFDQIIWFDIGDSTGTTHFPVIPFVDKYAKNQLLRDRVNYTKEYYSGRIFADFYHRVFGIHDSIAEEAHLKQAIPFDALGKLVIGWNSGLAYYGQYWRYYASLAWHLPWLMRVHIASWYPPSGDRKNTVVCRMGTAYSRETIAYPRQVIKHKLAGMVSLEPVAFNRYMAEMRHARAAVSPFGLGEISLRDFEATICGCAIVKQNMSHCETWPNLWVEGETYIDFDWDLSNFSEKIKFIEDNEESVIDYARKAQMIYWNAVNTQAGCNEFMSRVKRIVAYEGEG